ncbi:hypothetical protein [Pendulispora albinea]|uniref:Uncharacterized protein n=1 Tax=Pendulispora albinea TaxID=2741071 RepID=A0ABZ2LXS0_9BACT
MRHGCLLVATALATTTHLACASDRAPPSSPPPIGMSPAVAAGLWAVVQLVPSPLFVMSTGHVGAGVRWQITPFVYSFGVTAHPVRAFVVEPVARHSGAVELYVSPEWACCAPNDGTGWLARAGARLYLPIASNGETLAWSIGGSYYRASGGDGAAAEIGAYVFHGILGLSITVAPALAQREIINALTIRFF